MKKRFFDDGNFDGNGLKYNMVYDKLLSTVLNYEIGW